MTSASRSPCSTESSCVAATGLNTATIDGGTGSGTGQGAVLEEEAGPSAEVDSDNRIRRKGDSTLKEEGLQLWVKWATHSHAAESSGDGGASFSSGSSLLR